MKEKPVRMNERLNEWTYRLKKEWNGLRKEGRREGRNERKNAWMNETRDVQYSRYSRCVLCSRQFTCSLRYPQSSHSMILHSPKPLSPIPPSILFFRPQALFFNPLDTQVTSRTIDDWENFPLAAGVFIGFVSENQIGCTWVLWGWMVSA